MKDVLWMQKFKTNFGSFMNLKTVKELFVIRIGGDK